VQTLAERSGVGFRTLIRFEQSDGIPPSRSGTLREVQKCLEGAGVQFIGSPDDRPGIRFPAKTNETKAKELRNLPADDTSLAPSKPRGV